MSRPTGEIDEIKARFIEERGVWPLGFDQLAELHPDFVAAFVSFSLGPWGGGTLEPKVKELVFVALNVAATHLHVDGARRHIELAFQHGATLAELLEVCELVAAIGIHTVTMAAPILAEELADAGVAVATEFDEGQLELRERYRLQRGSWPPPFDSLLALDPPFVESYLNFSAAPWKTGAVSAKVRELLYIAMDSSTTHLHATGTRAHIRNALHEGATAGEILEVLEIASTVGLDGTTLGTALVFEVAASRAASRGQ